MNPECSTLERHPAANAITEIRYDFFAGLSSGEFPGHSFRLTVRIDGSAHYQGDAHPNVAESQLDRDIFPRLARRLRRMAFFDFEDTYDEILTMTLDGGSDRYRVRANNRFKEIYVNQEQSLPALNQFGYDLFTLTKSLLWRPGSAIKEDDLSHAWDAHREVKEPRLLAERRLLLLREAGLPDGWGRGDDD